MKTALVRFLWHSFLALLQLCVTLWQFFRVAEIQNDSALSVTALLRVWEQVALAAFVGNPHKIDNHVVRVLSCCMFSLHGIFLCVWHAVKASNALASGQFYGAKSSPHSEVYLERNT